MKLYEKFVFNVFIKKIYIKKAQKMQMKSLKGKFISNSFKESARLFLNKNKKIVESELGGSLQLLPRKVIL